MNGIVVAISGGIGSGKTSLASALVEHWKVPHASFGAFVRSEAAERGVPIDREHLQDLGETLIREFGWDKFCRATLQAGGWTTGATAVVEGVRHEAAFDAISKIVSPTRCVLVFIDADFKLREQRLVGGSLGQDLAKAEAHSTEQDVKSRLRERANLILDGTSTLGSLVAQVHAAFSSD